MVFEIITYLSFSLAASNFGEDSVTFIDGISMLVLDLSRHDCVLNLRYLSIYLILEVEVANVISHEPLLRQLHQSMLMTTNYWEAVD
jgi:hypothetical protein